MTNPFVAVVGAVNLDVCGKPFRPPVARDSNPGIVTTSLGGVGRNIAHNLALLGVPASLVTALGHDPGAQQVERSCEALGIDLTETLRVLGGVTSTYLVLTNHQGEMELAVSDMGIYDFLTPTWLSQKLDFLNTAAAVVVDANIPGETLARLGRDCAAPLFADPVSTAKAARLKPILGRLHTLKANRLEAELLSGVAITDDASLRTAARVLLATGLKRVFLSLGPDGVLAAQEGETARLPIFPGEMKNATGCGDAFVAALVWAYLNDLDLTQSAKAGLAAAAIALAGEETINPDLSALEVRRMLEV